MNANDKVRELVFNELTQFPLAADFSAAYQRVTQFLQTYKARPSIFDKRIRLENHIGELQLTDSISLQDFCKNPNGLIEIVLPHTDKGLGLIVQTTGRNIRETEKIAEIIKNRFN